MVEGVQMTVIEVQGGEPATWDLPQATQIQRLCNRNEMLPGFDIALPAAKNPSWMGVLWSAETSHMCTIATRKPQGEKLM